MSAYDTFTANVNGLTSAVKLEWTSTMDGTDSNGDLAVVASQSIYYTDVYESGDGGLIHDNKVVDLASDASSVTITGLTSDRAYDFTIVGKDNATTVVDFSKLISTTPHQLANVPVFTLTGDDSKVIFKVTNHRVANTSYIVFINGLNLTSANKIQTFVVADVGSTSNDKSTWTHQITGLTNTQDGVKSFYEVSIRAVNDVSTSAMSGSQSAEASDGLAAVTGLEVLTGTDRPANIPSKAVARWNAVTDATHYRVKAFTSNQTLAQMITDFGTSANDTWYTTTNLFLHMNFMTGSTPALAAGTEYNFAIIPATGTAKASASDDALAFVVATPSAIPDADDIDLTMTTGIDISNGTDVMAFAEMDGKLKLAWAMSQDEYDLLGNGLPLTGMTFDLSGTDNEVTKQLTVAGDLSGGSVIFSGLTNGKNYKTAVRTTNANGISATDPAFGAVHTKPVSTRPTNFTLIAGPAVGAIDYLQDGNLDLSCNMDNNGLALDRAADFLFDISGLDNTVSQVGKTLSQINGFTTATGKSYQITAKGDNANGDASPEEIVKTVRASKPPTVTSGNFAASRIYIKETTDLNKIVANFSNMSTVSNGYAVTGARVRAVYVDVSSPANNATWTGDWMIVDDFSKDLDIHLPAIVNSSDPHTTYKLDVEPFNAVYTKDYQIKDTDLSVSGYPDVMKSGLVMHTTPQITVTSARLAITDLRMTSDPSDMDGDMTFKWKCDAAGSANIELCLAEAGLNNDSTGYTVPKYSDFDRIRDLDSVLFVADDASTEMSFDLSNTGDVIFADGSAALRTSTSKAYYVMIREKAHPGNEERASGVSKSAPTVSDLSFADYTSRDLIRFTVNPNGAKLSSLFLLNNIDTTGDFFFNVLDSGAVASSIADKLENKVSGAIKVSIQKDQFQRDATAFPQNVLFNVLAGNSTGITLASANGNYADLNANDHPIDVAADALTWAIKAEALAVEALALAETINGQAGNSNGVKDNNTDSDATTPLTSDADDKAADVVAHSEFARGASNDAAESAITGAIYDATVSTANNTSGDNAEAQYAAAVVDMAALRLLSTQ